MKGHAREGEVWETPTREPVMFMEKQPLSEEMGELHSPADKINRLKIVGLTNYKVG
jgi:hypothetical protein